jgi:glutathione S-transferase
VTPVLWHISVSHYSEKARWALAWKGIEHERREPPPPAHMALALWWSKGRSKTFPVLELDGERIMDSATIIGALEAHSPKPPLYPEDQLERRRALDLADYFDANLGPAARHLGWHHLRRDRERLEELSTGTLPGPLRGFGPARRAAALYAGTFAGLRFGIGSDEGEAAARSTILAAADRLESELDGREYLAGGSFSVADLTAAALFYPVVQPAGAPLLPEPPETVRPFLAELRERPFWAWVERTYERHRHP